MQQSDRSKILITAGLGDFITIYAFLSNAERDAVQQIFYAARARYAIDSIIDSARLFPNLIKRTVVWDNWTETEEEEPGKVFCIVHKAHLSQCNDKHKWGLNLGILDNVTDLSIDLFFPEVRSGKRILNKEGGIEKFRLADISKFNLPSPYGVINPYSPRDRMSGVRDLSKTEWDLAIAYLERSQQTAVVINKSDDYIPNHPLIINLNGKTTPAEAIEIAKNCSFYVGIDSWLTCVVTKHLNTENMFIKCNNPHCINNFTVYFAPHNVFYFVYKSLEHVRWDAV